MTPTLLGRIQIRIVLYLLVGVPISVLFANYLDPWSLPGNEVPYKILTMILIVGLLLDPLYIYIQSYRWDQDWPFVFQFFIMILEFLIVVFLIDQQIWDWIGRETLYDNVTIILLHFTSVFLISFLCLLGFFQIFNLRWRFNGGKFSGF